MIGSASFARAKSSLNRVVDRVKKDHVLRARSPGGTTKTAENTRGGHAVKPRWRHHKILPPADSTVGLILRHLIFGETARDRSAHGRAPKQPGGRDTRDTLTL